MGELNKIKNSGGTKGKEKRNQKFCRKYHKRLAAKGIDVIEGASEDVINVTDGDYDNNRYIDLETVGLVLNDQKKNITQLMKKNE